MSVGREDKFCVFDGDDSGDVDGDEGGEEDGTGDVEDDE